MARLHRGPAQGDGEVSLPDAGRAKEQHILRLCHVAPGGELSHQLCVDGGLRFEIEVLERLHGGEMGNLNSHGHALALLGVHLRPQDDVEEV